MHGSFTETGDASRLASEVARPDVITAMATLRQHPSGWREVEISDLALVSTVLGLVAAVIATAWIVTRDHRNLKQLAKLATARRARLVHHGRPLLP
jgi:hypothetical protein